MKAMTTTTTATISWRTATTTTMASKWTPPENAASKVAGDNAKGLNIIT